MNPLVHYLTHGAAERRKPHPWFDPEFYLAGCDAASQSEAARNPLLHFLRWKAASPHPLFDLEVFDLEAFEPDDASVNPLIAYVLSGEPDPGSAPFRIGDVPIACVLAEDAPVQQRRFLRSVNPGQLRALMNP